MTVQWGDTGRASIGSLKSFTLTQGTPRETLLGSPIILPTTEPTTSQVSWTIQQSDLPTITPSVSMGNAVNLIVAGKVGASASTVNYRILKNGVSVSTGSASSVSANYYWCHNHFRVNNVQVGDVLEVKSWASTSDCGLDFYALVLWPIQPELYNRSKSPILKDVSFTVTGGASLVSSGLSIYSTAGMYIWPTTSTYAGIYTSSNVTYPTMIPFQNYYIYSLNYGENTTNYTYTTSNTTSRQYVKNCFPSQISFREIAL